MMAGEQVLSMIIQCLDYVNSCVLTALATASLGV